MKRKGKRGVHFSSGMGEQLEMPNTKTGGGRRKVKRVVCLK